MFFHPELFSTVLYCCHCIPHASPPESYLLFIVLKHKSCFMVPYSIHIFPFCDFIALPTYGGSQWKPGHSYFILYFLLSVLLFCKFSFNLHVPSSSIMGDEKSYKLCCGWGEDIFFFLLINKKLIRNLLFFTSFLVSVSSQELRSIHALSNMFASYSELTTSNLLDEK